MYPACLFTQLSIMATQSPSSAGMIPVSMRNDILLELVEIASSNAKNQLDAFITRLSDALLASADTTRADAEETRQYLEAATYLKKNRYPFYYAITERLAASLQREMQAISDLPMASDAEDTLQRTAPEIEVDRKLCLIKASRAIESEHAERLTALNLRLAHLLGRDALNTDQNPFRPQIFLSAIDEAWCGFHPDPAAHPLMFRLLGPELCLDIGPILHAQNAALIKRGVLPVLTQPRSEMLPPSGENAQDDTPLARQLRNLFPVEPSPAAGNGDRPLAGALPTLFADEQLQATVARDKLLAYLTQIQRNGPDPRHTTGTPAQSLLAHVRQWAPADTLTPADAHTIDLLIVVFESVFGNAAIPTEIRTLIGSLQIPVLKATLTDRNFFFRPEHPVRRVIELLARLGTGWDRKSGPNDPLYQTILRNVKRIQSDQRVPSFSAALTDIDAFIANEETASGAVLANTIADALQQEKRLQATKAARHAVDLRIGTGEVVAFVETFLEDKWVTVLTLAYTLQDEKPEVVENAVKTMDDLCWSVKPKITMAERKELLAKLPSLIAQLNKWLDLIRWNDEERVKFFNDLARCHASIARAPLELSPERQMRIALAVAKKAAERRMQRQVWQQPEPEPDEYVRMVERLECGSWIDFSQNGGAAARLRLAWISPMRNLFIFSTHNRQEALSLTAEELARALRENRARVALAAGLVAQALEQALTAANGAGQAVA